jgi:type IVB pilus formation R64 PilN family outer membrane protein
MQNTFKLTAIAASVLVLTGCGTMNPFSGDKESKSHHEKVTEQAERLNEEKRNTQITHTSAQPVVYNNGVYVAKTTARKEKEENLPAVFYESVWFNTTVKDINEFAERITLRTRVPTVVGTDVMEEMLDRSERLSEIADNMAEANKGSFPPLPASLPGVVPTMDSAGVRARQMALAAMSDNELKINYSGGTLKGLLDMVASRYGVSWKFERDQIRFFMHDTRTFHVRAIPGSAQASASVNAGGNQTIGSGNGQQTTGMNSDISIWTGVQDSINAMLSDKGRAVISPATSSITVTDTPTVLNRVAAFVDTQNSLMSKQVMVNVEVLSVSTSRGNDYSIQWNAVYDNLLKQYGIRNTVADASTSGAVSMSFGIIQSNSKWNGTQAVINALSEQGKVSKKHTGSVVALNNQPAPLRVGRQFSYVAESSIQQTEIGTTTSITQGSINSGFSMQVLPTIMPDGQVILQFAADITALRDLRSVASGEIAVESPDYDSQNFLQRVRMRSGETLVLSGYEYEGESRNNAGVGSPFFPLLGGGISNNRSRETTVVLVTPVVIN